MTSGGRGPEAEKRMAGGGGGRGREKLPASRGGAKYPVARALLQNLTWKRERGPPFGEERPGGGEKREESDG